MWLPAEGAGELGVEWLADVPDAVEPYQIQHAGDVLRLLAPPRGADEIDVLRGWVVLETRAAGRRWEAERLRASIAHPTAALSPSGVCFAADRDGRLWISGAPAS